jgi:hypothetical protein
LWVNNVYTGAENRHGFSLGMNRATMRGGVDAPRQYAENHPASAREIARQPLGHLQSVGRWVSGSDDSDPGRGNRLYIPSHIENEQRIVDLFQLDGIG